MARSGRRLDGVLLATIAGMTGALAKDMPDFALRFLKVLRSNYWELAAAVLLPPEQAGTPGGLFIGAAVDLILGGALGILILAVFHIFGRDLWWYKGLVCGNIIWLLGPGLILSAMSVLKPFSVAFRLSSLLDHELFGLTTTYIIWRWSKPETQKTETS